jgi:hypothetical protein
LSHPLSGSLKEGSHLGSLLSSAYRQTRIQKKEGKKLIQFHQLWGDQGLIWIELFEHIKITCDILPMKKHTCRLYEIV